MAEDSCMEPLKIPILRHYLRSIKSDQLNNDPMSLLLLTLFNNFSRWFSCKIRIENHWTGWSINVPQLGNSTSLHLIFSFKLSASSITLVDRWHVLNVIDLFVWRCDQGFDILRKKCYFHRSKSVKKVCKFVFVAFVSLRLLLIRVYESRSDF